MADNPLLDLYGLGARTDDPGPDEVYSTADVLRGIRPDNLVSRPLRGLAELLRSFAQGPAELPQSQGKLAKFIANSGAGGADTMANWLDRHPKVGPDTLAPLGLAAIGTAPMGALAAGAMKRRGYHGSDRGFPHFKESDTGGLYGDLNVPHDGVWFGDTPARSEYFAKKAIRMNEGDPASTGPAIYPADLEFKNPYHHSPTAVADEGVSSLPPLDELRARGHDGVVVPRAEWIGTGSQPGDFRLVVHGNDYAAIAPNTVTSPLSGKTLFADSSRASLPGTVVNGLEQAQKPTAGRTPMSERGARLDQGREAFDARGPNWMESGERLSPLGTQHTGGPASQADMALRRAGGDIEKALALLADNPQAGNVLKYWHQDGQSFRAYADPARAQSYWKGAEDFTFAETPFRLNADAAGSNVPGLVAGGLEQGSKPSLAQRLDELPEVPRRETLASDFNVTKEPFGDGSVDWRIDVPGGILGSRTTVIGARADPQNQTLHILGSDLPREMRGQGQGVAAYQRMIDEAHRHGYEVKSDASVSGEARRVYEALAERGYEVQRNPGAREKDGGRLATWNYEDPVFTVWPPRRAYSAPEASAPGAFVPPPREPEDKLDLAALLEMYGMPR